MSVNYKEVRNERQWKATTGLSEPEFNSLTIAFGQAYERLYEVRLEQGAENLKQELVLSSYGDCLYFTLFQLKTAQSYDCLGVLFNMDGSSALRNFQKYLRVLELALHQQQALPRRHFETLEEFKKYLRSEPELISDVTELRTERPADKQRQQDRYSGKKKSYR
jgi:hypothetical protein